MNYKKLPQQLNLNKDKDSPVSRHKWQHFRLMFGPPIASIIKSPEKSPHFNPWQGGPTAKDLAVLQVDRQL